MTWTNLGRPLNLNQNFKGENALKQKEKGIADCLRNQHTAVNMLARKPSCESFPGKALPEKLGAWGCVAPFPKPLPYE